MRPNKILRKKVEKSESCITIVKPFAIFDCQGICRRLRLDGNITILVKINRQSSRLKFEFKNTKTNSRLLVRAFGSVGDEEFQIKVTVLDNISVLTNEIVMPQLLDFWTDFVVTVIVKKVPTEVIKEDLAKAEAITDDVKIVCDKQVFNVHKSILVLRSNLFKELFSGDTIIETINVENSPPNTIKTLIQCIISDYLTPNTGTLELLLAADKFGMENLAKLCEKDIFDHLTEVNAINYVGEIRGRGGRWNQLRSKYPELMLRIFQTAILSI